MAEAEAKPGGRGVLAAILTLVVPGSGHVARGQLQRGLLWFSGMLILAHATLAVVLVVRSGPAVPILFAISLGGALALRVIALIDVVRRPPAAQLPRPIAVVVWCVVLAAATGGASATSHCFARAYRMPSGSMIPTVLLGDHILVDRRAPARRGDIVAFRYPKDPDKSFVKRVVAVGGDTVELNDDIPVVNGQPLERRPVAPGGAPCEYQAEEDESQRMSFRRCAAFVETQGDRSYTVIHDQGATPRSFPAVQVPPGHLYVLGDNRDNSHDSRYWGTVPPENYEGRAFVIWWSSGDGPRRDRIGRSLEK